MIGTMVAQYRIEETLGEGGMGVVYKAKDTRLDRFVALKFLSKEVAATDTDRQRFLQEARAAATLSHPNICTVYDVAEHEGRLFIAMEYIEGVTLRDRTANASMKQSIDIAVQIAEGLAAAHEKGIVHRDIKPENMMLRKDGLVQIMDFGLAKREGVSRLTREGSTVGTLGYMSPEQVQGFAVDHRSDIFSFGVVLYELLTGRSPFNGVHETAIIYEIVNVDPEPATIVRPELPPDVDAILLECLAKEPEERYQSAKEIVKDLRKLKRESSRQTASRVLAVRQSRIASGVRPAAQTAEIVAHSSGRPFLRHAWMIAAVALFVLLAGAVAYYVVAHRADGDMLRVSFNTSDGTIFNSTNGGHIEISPDGTMIAFVATDSVGNDLLWVRPLSTAAPMPLAGTENATYPFWSWDGRMIGYFAGGKLKKVDAKGGPSFTICDAPNGRGGSWNEAGVIVFAPLSSGPLQQVSAAGGAPKPLTSLDSTEMEVNHRWPFFLPDGDHFLYSAQTNKASLEEDAEQVRVGSLSAGNGPVVVRATTNAVYDRGVMLYYKQNSVLAQPFDPGSLRPDGDPAPILENILYQRDRSKGAFSVSRTGRMVYLGTSRANDEMVVMSSAGVILNRVRIKSAPTSGSFSPDARFYAVDIHDEVAKNTDVWIHDLVRNSDIRLTFDKGVEIVPEWSPDGKKIYFSSNRKGTFSIYVKNSNGTGSEELVYAGPSPSYCTDVSYDGRRLLISTQTQGPQKWDIGLYDLGTKTYTPLLTSEFNEWLGCFSPDGRWFTYQSNETGRYEVYIRPTDGSPSKWQVSTDGGNWPRWSKSGREIVYNIGDQQIIATAVTVSGGQIDVGRSTVLTKIDAGYKNSVTDISSDGGRLLLSRTLNTQLLKNGSLIVNWRTMLEKE